MSLPEPHNRITLYQALDAMLSEASDPRTCSLRESLLRHADCIESDYLLQYCKLLGIEPASVKTPSQEALGFGLFKRASGSDATPSAKPEHG